MRPSSVIARATFEHQTEQPIAIARAALDGHDIARERTQEATSRELARCVWFVFGKVSVNQCEPDWAR